MCGAEQLKTNFPTQVVSKCTQGCANRSSTHFINAMIIPLSFDLSHILVYDQKHAEPIIGSLFDFQDLFSPWGTISYNVENIIYLIRDKNFRFTTKTIYGNFNNNNFFDLSVTSIEISIKKSITYIC